MFLYDIDLDLETENENGLFLKKNLEPKMWNQDLAAQEQPP